MSRALVVLHTASDRMRVARWAETAPHGTRVEFKETKRTLPQNARFYAMLTDIARQKEHCGRKYGVQQWKALFLHGMGRECDFIPSLDGSTFLPLGYSSSDLSKQEMSDLIEFMFAWGAANGVTFQDDQSPAIAPEQQTINDCQNEHAR